MHCGNQELNPSKKEAEWIREKNLAEAFDKAAGARNTYLLALEKVEKIQLESYMLILNWACISVLLKWSCHSSVSINFLILRMFKTVGCKGKHY